MVKDKHTSRIPKNIDEADNKKIVTSMIIAMLFYNMKAVQLAKEVIILIIMLHLNHKVHLLQNE